MVLACRFRRSGLRFPLSGLACAQVAAGEIRSEPGEPQTQRELLNARRSTRMPRVRRGHENKNDCIDSGAVLCRSGSVLRRRRLYGHWKLNEAKSKIAPNAPKNNTVVYEAAGDNVKITVDGIGNDGKPTHDEWTGKFDGKDYPVTGNPNSDMRSYKKIDEHTLEFNVKKGGKITTSGRVVVSADGKSRTVTTSGTDSQGKKFKSTAVYEKQEWIRRRTAERNCLNVTGDGTCTGM